MFNWFKTNINGDKVIWIIAIVLSTISLLSVYSATGSLAYQKMGGNTEYYLFKHFVLIILSLFAMWFSHKLDYKYYSKFGWKEDSSNPYVWHDVEGKWYEQIVNTGERVYI